MTDMTELNRPVIQVIAPDNHDDYKLAEPMRVVAEGKYIVVLKEAAAEKPSFLEWFLSGLGLRDVTPAPTVLLESGTDSEGRAIKEGYQVRVRGEPTHLENIYEAKETHVMAQTVES